MTILDWSQSKQKLGELHDEYSGVVCDSDGVTLNWRGEYFIYWEQIKTKEKLVQWCHHLLEKGWFTPIRCRIFLEAVCEYRKWELYS